HLAGSRSRAGHFTNCSPIPSMPAKCGTENRCIPVSIRPILQRRLWDKVQHRLRDRAARGARARTKAAMSPLAGKLFDEHRQPLYVQGAAKGRRRYRYYVSRALVRGLANPAGGGWRIPALEMERVIVGAAKAFLDDRPAVLAALQESEI